ncbi:protein LLP-like protein [Euroglyphus maynei]|uniref:Protein LLP-like protein n=1 Tax=Euroglyphus maynei TaxID=6958 RepID=A0A1Y3AQB0_EURMA|nr:protein LLP-like protein [Euroglyphus maynei]
MVQKSEQNEKQAQEEMKEIILKKSPLDVDEKLGENADYIEMETDQNERDRKTLLNKFGQYPAWMNGRRLKRQKTLVKRLKKKKSKV